MKDPAGMTDAEIMAALHTLNAEQGQLVREQSKRRTAAGHVMKHEARRRAMAEGNKA